MKYIFLLNTFSIGKKTNNIINGIECICKKRSIDYKIEINSNEKTIEEILKKYENEKNIIFAVGGDGTINRVLNGIINTKNVLGYIPLGTGNDFYKSNKELFKNKINEIDLVKINNKYFINSACFGIDADIGKERIVHSKLIPKSKRYSLPAIKNIIKYKGKKLIIKIADKEYSGIYTTVAVANGRYYGGGFKVAPSALLDDGLLDVYIANKMSRYKMIKMFKKLKKGNHEDDKSITKMTIKELKIESPEEISCLIDGEVLSDKKFVIKVIPKGIKIFYDAELIKELSE